jgi:hypothetical protein
LKKKGRCKEMFTYKFFVFSLSKQGEEKPLARAERDGTLWHHYHRQPEQ